MREQDEVPGAERSAQFRQARIYFEQALKIHRAIGLAQTVLGDAASAHNSFCQAAELLDRGRAQSAVSPAKQAETLASYQSIRHDCLRSEIAAGNTSEAFDVLERGRGENLRTLLAQRDLAFSRTLAAPLQREWLEGEQKIKSLHARLSIASAQTDNDLSEQLARAQAQRAHMIGRMRAASPKLAALL